MRLLNVACIDCSLVHNLPENEFQACASAVGFCDRHKGHQIVENVVVPGMLHFDEDFARNFAENGWRGNSDVKTALQAAQSMTVTNLHSLGSSATAGWQSTVVDNTSNLYLDSLVMAVIDFANTAPANSKCVFFFAYHGLESGTYTNPVTGSEGTLTLLDVTANAQAMKMLGILPYTTADEVAESVLWSVAATAGGILPPYWGVAAINHTGAAIAASGNTIKFRGVFATVV